jgi:cytochrome c-type biogenesis protein CcmH
MIERIETHLAKEPNDGRGWELIAPIYLRLGRFEDAIQARRKALALNGETAERQAGLGEALAGAANGTVTPEAKAAFERAVALDAKNVRGRYYLGVAAEQDGRPADAAAIFRAMLAGAPADAPWVEFIRSELARLDGGANGNEMAAGGDIAPDQLVMIRRMVAGLAERLQKDGSDLEGWLRLMQSYMVLGERDKAVAAAGDARRAFASEPDKLRRIDEFAKGLGLQG